MKKISLLKIYSKHFILVVSVIMIGIGITREENMIVLQKAINICLECIGIG